MTRAGSAALLAGLLAATPAAADEPIERRLAALRALIASESAPPPRARAAARALAAPRPPATRDRCAPSWWRESRAATRARIEAAVRDAARRYSVDRRLIRSVIREESAGAVHAVSHAGAQGLMQLMPATARELGVRCPFDPRENVLGGTRYLRRMRDRMGSWPRALAAYNAGPTRIESGHWPAETRRYVTRVMRRWRPNAPVSLPR